MNNSNDSLFTYGEGEDWSTFYKPDFVPFFEPVFSDPLLEDQANTICGDDSFCLYDIAATGRTDIGISTFQANLELERIINNTLPGAHLVHIIQLCTPCHRLNPRLIISLSCSGSLYC